MLTRAGSDARQDAEASPRPSPIESLPLELLSRITLLALDPTDGTKHSPENSTILRSLALVSRTWYHSAVRELVASPRITSPFQLGVFLALVERLGFGNRVKEILIDGGNLPVRKRVQELDEDSLVGVDREALEQQYLDEWMRVAGPRWTSDKSYEDSMDRLARLCPRIAALRLSGMVWPEGVLHGVESLPLETLWIDTSFLTTKPFQHVPPTLRALHFMGVPMIVSDYLELSQLSSPSLLHISCRNTTFTNGLTPRTSSNGTIFDTITSLLLGSNSTTIAALKYEYFPELVHLEIVDTERPPANRRLSALARIQRLPKLQNLTLPDAESWREIWNELVDSGGGGAQQLKIIWKAVA
ncbi:hypothetical protein RQP46_002138 [Phenoliferia psychrophenolica]